MIINTNHRIINMTTNDGLEFISRYNKACIITVTVSEFYLIDMTSQMSGDA